MTVTRGAGPITSLVCTDRRAISRASGPGRQLADLCVGKRVPNAVREVGALRRSGEESLEDGPRARRNSGRPSRAGGGRSASHRTRRSRFRSRRSGRRWWSTRSAWSSGSPSERRVPSKAVEHVEEPPVVEHVEQAHDLAHPAPHDGQRGPGAVGGACPFDLNATAVSTT
jgi:hypothetical protein